MSSVSDATSPNSSYPAASFSAGFAAGLPVAFVVHATAFNCCGIEPVAISVAGHGVHFLTNTGNPSFDAGFRAANLSMMMLVMANTRAKYHRLSHLLRSKEPEIDFGRAPACGTLAALVMATITTHLVGSHTGLFVGSVTALTVTEGMYP